MKLYCGTYAKYNEGSLKGKWLDLDDYDDADEFLAACRELHADETDPEFMFQDVECDYGWERTLYGESTIPREYWEIRDAVSGGIGEEVFDAWLEFQSERASLATLARAEEQYLGEYSSGADFAEREAEECGDLSGIPAWIERNIDWDGVWREMETDGYFEQDGHFFNSFR